MIYLPYKTDITTFFTSCDTTSTFEKYPFNIVQLINKDTLEETLFYSPDSSASPYYNEFVVQQATQSDPSQWTINNVPGQYTMNIYGGFDTNIDIEGKALIGSYILNIVGTYSSDQTWNNTGAPITTYNNQDRI